MEHLVEPIIELVKYLGSSACIYLDYHINFNKAVIDLKGELEALNNRKEDINSSIRSADLREREVKHEVQGWLDRVQTINIEVQDIEEKVQRVKWYSRGRLGKLVRRKIEVVKEIYGQGSFPDGLVIDRPPTPTRGMIVPTENVVGETSVKERIWEYLTGNEVGMIGVYGIGGAGKTTIMKHINNKLSKESKFDKVIWVTVSYPLNVNKLQEKIACAVDDRQKLPEADDDDDDKLKRAASLMKIMRRVKYVLILDDVWEQFSLKDVGIPEPTLENGCKVVITSRKIDVCQYLSCQLVKVQPLSAQESLDLFLDKVGRDILQDPNLERILKLIVKECGGLPLAIAVIAGGMKGEDDFYVWRNALNELRKRVKSVNDSDKEIFERLKFSYDRLNDLKIQKCFLFCSLFQEDYEFFIEELIEGWIDEGLIDELGGREAAYDMGHVFLSRLVKNCLLEKTVDDLLRCDVVKMHDVVRDMAVKSIGPGVGYMVKAGMKLREVPKQHEWVTDLNKVSLMANNISKIPVGLSPKCSSLSTLILSDNPFTEILESFLEDMSGLKVLDLSRTKIQTLPGSISKLEYLSTLRLRSCERLKCLPSLEKLVALKKLDLKWAGIGVVPQGMEMLVSLEYLDFSCTDMTEIPMGILSELSNLQYLAATGDDFRQPNVKIKLEEVARLRKLEILKCNLDDVEDFNYFLSEFNNFQSLIAYTLSVGARNYSGWALNHNNKCELTISGCEIGEKCIVLPDNLQQLIICKCKNMRSSLNKSVLLENATRLNLCMISDCEETEYVVELDSSSSSLCCPVLNKLEWLRLFYLPRLLALVRVDGVATMPCVFSNLKNLKIKGCSGMRKLLPPELLQALQNLEVIEVGDCEQMEEIIASSDSDASSDKFTFPKLRKLDLCNLPQLKSICNGKGVIVCDSIEEIWIDSCQELKRIPVQLPLLDNGQPSPLSCLKKICLDPESKEWWESVEWDHPNAKYILQPFLNYSNLNSILGKL